MSTPRGISRSPLATLAGVALIGDAICAFALGGVLVSMSLFQPVAAIQGQAPTDQAQWLPALAFMVVGAGAAWAGVGTARGRRRGHRLVGVAVAGGAAVLFAWWLVTAPPSTLPASLMLAALVGVHVLVAAVLLGRARSAAT